MSKTIRLLLALLLAFSCINAASGSCFGSILSNGPDLVKDGSEITAGDYSDLGSFVNSLANICSGCYKNCTFLSDLSAGHLGGDAIECVNGITNTISGAVQAASTVGTDVIGDVELLVGIYNAIKDCDGLVKDV